MINTYHLSNGDGDLKLSESFRVREFSCKDGSDIIKIDTELVKYLQRIRNWACVPVIISSGYRTPAHNASIGGAKSSKHCTGQAADIYTQARFRSIQAISRYAEAIGIKGIECNEDKNYVHIDTRTSKWFCYYRGGKYHNTSTFGGHCPYAEPKRSLRRGMTGNDVRWLQFWLNLWDCGINIDGKFGECTELSVKHVQEMRGGLVVDGIAGEKTRAALKGY